MIPLRFPSCSSSCLHFLCLIIFYFIFISVFSFLPVFHPVSHFNDCKSKSFFLGQVRPSQLLWSQCGSGSCAKTQMANWRCLRRRTPSWLRPQWKTLPACRTQLPRSATSKLDFPSRFSNSAPLRSGPNLGLAKCSSRQRRTARMGSWSAASWARSIVITLEFSSIVVLWLNVAQRLEIT